MPIAKRHFVGVSETGELLDDPRAFSIEEEFMSDKYGMASPDTPAVPYLTRPTWDHDFKRAGWRHVMLSVPIGASGNWLFRQAYAIWKAAHTSVRGPGGPGWMSDRKLGVYALLASIACFFAVIVTTGGGEAQPANTPAQTPSAQEVQADPQSSGVVVRDGVSSETPSPKE